MKNKSTITVQATVNAPVKKVWNYWTEPEHIMRWNNASDDWHCPRAESDLRPGGKFMSRMEAKDGSMGFDFRGIYDEVKEHELITYTMEDGRKVSVEFSGNEEGTMIRETFEPERMNSREMQKAGWQAILDHFKKHTEMH